MSTRTMGIELPQVDRILCNIAIVSLLSVSMVREAMLQWNLVIELEGLANQLPSTILSYAI